MPSEASTRARASTSWFTSAYVTRRPSKSIATLRACCANARSKTSLIVLIASARSRRGRPSARNELSHQRLELREAVPLQVVIAGVRGAALAHGDESLARHHDEDLAEVAACGVRDDGTRAQLHVLKTLARHVAVERHQSRVRLAREGGLLARGRERLDDRGIELGEDRAAEVAEGAPLEV